jgi:ABC-type lipoprotein release transport system permease subunit
MISSALYSHWIRSAFFFLIRSGRSTFALGLMVVAAISSLIFLSSLAVGINDAMIRNSVGLFSGHISATGLPGSIGPEDLMVKGTKQVLKRIPVPGMISLENRTEAVNMIGLDPLLEGKTTALAKKIIRGREVRKRSAEILLSKTIAEKLGTDIGDTLHFNSENLERPVTLTVSGIYKTGIPSLDLVTVFCPADVLPAKSSSWNAAVFLQDDVQPETIVSSYKVLLGKDYAFMTWKEFMPDLVQLINLNYISMSIVIILVFGVVSLGIGCAFVVFIFKSLREYGIMKAMGVSSGEVVFLIITEVVLINIAACVAGGLLGVTAVLFFSHSGIDFSYWTSHNQYFVVSGLIFPRMTSYALMTPPAASLGFGLISALWPALLVARKKAVDVLKVI